MNIMKKAKGIGEILMTVTYACVGLFAKDTSNQQDKDDQQQPGEIKPAVDKNIQKDVVVKGKKDKDGSISNLEICLSTRCNNVTICMPALDKQSKPD